MKVTILIPCKEIGLHVQECVRHCLLLDYPEYEILVLPNSPTDGELQGARVVSTGDVGPSEKRDFGASLSDGDLLAFIDDDAYPSRGWLREAVRHFEDEDVAAVGGPAVTPPHDDLFQKASGMVYSSPLGGGNLAYRYIPKEGREVDDFPSCNLIVRREIFEELGGFNTQYWPGEDTKLCFEITHKLKKKIVYDPKVLIYHHRRRLFLPHLRQVWNYALHRGYFAKRFPATSLRPGYFLPSLLVVGLLTGPLLSAFSPAIQTIYIAGGSLYLGGVLLSSLQKDLRLIPLVFLGIPLTHITYGIGFMKGMVTGELER
jgi:glycosyltransferase involved in cell wall biosynthesis